MNLQPDVVLLVRMVFEMLYSVDSDAYGLTYGMWTGHFAAAFQARNVVFDMPSESVLLIKDPRTIFEIKSLVPNAKKILKMVTLY